MGSAARPSDHRPRTLLLECAAVATIVFVAYAISRPDAVATLGRLYDDVVYLSVGKSIAEGHGYRSAQLVGTPVHVKFPPLLPGVYAILWLVFGTLHAVASAALWINVVVTAASAGVLWWLARRELGVSPLLAAPFVAVPIVTDRTMFYFSGAASEPWMLLGWAIALVLVRRLTRTVAGSASGDGTAVALGVTLVATALSRTQGIVIAAAVIAGLALSRVGRRAWIIATSSTVVPLIVWSAWHGAMVARGPVSPLPDQSGYTAWIPMKSVGEFAAFAVAMIRTSVPLYWSNAADVLVGWTSPKTLALAGAILATGAAGVVMLARRFPEMAASVTATLAVLAIWPYVQDRFLTPVLPMLGVAGAFATQQAIVRIPSVVRRWGFGLAALVAVVLLVQNARLRAESVRGQSTSPYSIAIADMADWVERRTAPGDHIMMSWGGAIYLRTGRRTSIANPEEPTLGASVLASPDRFYATRLLDDSVSDVIIWDRAPGRAASLLRDLAARCVGLLTEVDHDSSTAATRHGIRFYRVQRDLPCLVALRNAEPADAGNKNAP